MKRVVMTKRCNSSVNKLRNNKIDFSYTVVKCNEDCVNHEIKFLVMAHSHPSQNFFLLNYKPTI